MTHSLTKKRIATNIEKVAHARCYLTVAEAHHAKASSKSTNSFWKRYHAEQVFVMLFHWIELIHEVENPK